MIGTPILLTDDWSSAIDEVDHCPQVARLVPMSQLRNAAREYCLIVQIEPTQTLKEHSLREQDHTRLIMRRIKLTFDLDQETFEKIQIDEQKCI